jgi:hypothetical protein
MDNIHSQNKAILKALQGGAKLTPLDMLINFNTLRASARIYDLKHEGHNIQSKMIKVGTKRVSQYFLEN